MRYILLLSIALVSPLSLLTGMVVEAAVAAETQAQVILHMEVAQAVVMVVAVVLLVDYCYWVEFITFSSGITVKMRLMPLVQS